MAAEYGDALVASGRFDAVEVRHYNDTRAYSTEQWIAEVPTHSDHQVLSETTRTELLDALAHGLNGRGAPLTVSLRTHVVTALYSAS